MMPPNAHGKIVTADFQPHPLLRHAHLQTTVPALWRPLPALDLKIERWELEDGDYVDLGWFAAPRPGQPIAVLVHGLTGGFESKYVRGTAQQLKARGWAGLILQLRGSGPQPNRLTQAYHQGDTTDLHALLRRLRREYADAVLATVGWSLGANIVLKAAGEAGENYPADFLVAASVPFALEPCAQRMRQGLSRAYQRRLLKDLKAMAQRKAAMIALPSGVDLQRTLAAPDFFEFDEAWTAPLNGFASALDYYDKTQCGPFLKSIARPGLLVHSRDDPFMQADIVPNESDLAASLTLEISERGGHVGFIAAAPNGRMDYWLDRRLADWLQEQLPR